MGAAGRASPLARGAGEEGGEVAPGRGTRDLPGLVAQGTGPGPGEPADLHPAAGARRVALTQSRNARTGSIRGARQAGTRQAASAAIAITTKAAPNASGSRGLT